MDKALGLERGNEKKEKKQSTGGRNVLDFMPGSSHAELLLEDRKREERKNRKRRRKRVGKPHSDCHRWSGGICCTVCKNRPCSSEPGAWIWRRYTHTVGLFLYSRLFGQIWKLPDEWVVQILPEEADASLA